MKHKVTAAAKRPRKANGGSETLGPNSEIGRKLKQYYDELVSEEVPDRFSDLLRRLEEREPASSTSDGR